jgi:hypothetical protein
MLAAAVAAAADAADAADAAAAAPEAAAVSADAAAAAAASAAGGAVMLVRFVVGAAAVKLRGLVPSFYIHASGSDLYIRSYSIISQS